MRRTLKLALCIAMALALCGCANSGVPISQDEPTLTLPPANAPYVAPIGDAALEYTSVATLYLPRHDGARLGALNEKVTLSYSRPDAESIVRALLASSGDGVLSAVGGDVRLSLYGANPVELSRDVATVNLSATALQLDRRSLYTAAQAIAGTLCELPQISYVNLLVMDKPIGLDIGDALPMGSLNRGAAQDIASTYENLLSRREGSLSSNVTLYFPVKDAGGFMSEARVCSFADREPSAMITTVIKELASGSQQGINTSIPPLLGDILASPPTVTEPSAAGGKVIELDFDGALDGMLEAYGLTREQCFASICYTLCTFFPNVAGVRLSIGGERVSGLALSGAGEAPTALEDGVAKRSDFSSFLLNECALYFSDGERLAATLRPVRYYGSQSPRALLIELARGPQPCDSVQGLMPVMPEGAITDADILGLAIDDGTLLANFAVSFEKVCGDAGAENERMLAYAITNTLCQSERASSLCVFISGAQRETFSGEIYWGGLFYPMR